MADFTVSVEGHRCFVDFQWREFVLQHLEQLNIDHELLHAGDEASLEPSGGVHDEVRSGQEGGHQRHHRFVAGLSIGHL